MLAGRLPHGREHKDQNDRRRCAGGCARGVRRVAFIALGVGILMLAATLFVGQEVKGARRWVNILGISIRTLRNKLNEYSADGVPVPPPGGGEVRGAA